METKKGIRALFFTVMVVFIICGMAAYSYADCPDRVDCERPAYHSSKLVGNINVPTCYQFGKGCRPWHCNGQYKNTDRDYWTDKCRKAFSNCTADNNCEANFPGALNQ